VVGVSHQCERCSLELQLSSVYFTHVRPLALSRIILLKCEKLLARIPVPIPVGRGRAENPENSRRAPHRGHRTLLSSSPPHCYILAHHTAIF
jgi:hypothetical protein